MKVKERIILYGLLGVLVILAFSLVFIREVRTKRNVFVFFLDYAEENQSAYLVPVKRTISRPSNIEERIKSAISLLLEGPDEKEQQAGLNTAMPENASLIEVELKGNIIFLDFSKDIEQGGGITLMMDRLAQIVYTATQFSSASKVQLLIDGNSIKYFSGEGITEVEKPMDRNNFNYTIKTITGGQQNEGKDTSGI